MNHLSGWPSDDDHQAQLRQFSALHFLISRILAIRQSGITGLFTPGEQLSTSALVTNLMNSLITRNNASLATAGAQGLTNPLSSLFGLTSPFSLNPNGPDALSLYDSCSASGGRSNDRLGVCLPSALCSIYPNARANGTCGPLGANVCCFSKSFPPQLLSVRIVCLLSSCPPNRHGFHVRNHRHPEQHGMAVSRAQSAS